MLTKNVTDDSTLGLKKAAVKLELPAIEIDVVRAESNQLNTEIKARLLDVVDQIIEKNLT
tara:strand:+ start:346 stop:525 length:180 start_codon:yes stop_codon:yes gene_type:complete